MIIVKNKNRSDTANTEAECQRSSFYRVTISLYLCYHRYSLLASRFGVNCVA